MKMIIIYSPIFILQNTFYFLTILWFMFMLVQMK